MEPPGTRSATGTGTRIAGQVPLGFGVGKGRD